MLTIKELQYLLSENFDSDTICEILDINSKDLVTRFYDKIEERQEELIKDFEKEEEWEDIHEQFNDDD